MVAEDKAATRRRRGMVRACKKDKITLRKVKHEMNARVTISRRRGMVRAYQKKVTELNPAPNTSTFFLLPNTLKWTVQPFSPNL